MTGPFLNFFELRDNPFRSNPDPHFLFCTEQTQKSLDQLSEGIRERKGLLLLTGEVGTGKTVLLNRLRERLQQERMPTAFIYNSHLKASDLFELVLAEFGIPLVAQRGTPLAHLNSWLQDRFLADQTPVLFVDEAQGLPRNAIEELRMLLNLQTPEGNLLQIVLCGQPEFEEALKRPELRPIFQRVALRCRTLPLTRDEIQNYIEYRQRIAGASDAPIFQPEAVQALFLYSRGIPRVLNLLCEQALMRASREKVRPVAARMVGEAAHEFQFDSVKPLGPDSALNSAVSSDLFVAGPVLGGLPNVSAADTLCDTRLNANSPSVPNLELQQESPSVALSEPDGALLTPTLSSATMYEHAFGPPRNSKAPIEFKTSHTGPSPLASTRKETTVDRDLTSQVGTSTEELLTALSAAAPEIVAPVPRVLTMVSKQKSDFHKHEKRHGVSAAQPIKSAVLAGASFTRIHVARLRTSGLFLLQFLARQWSYWRTKNWNVSIPFQWVETVTSCLQWLRAPATARKVRHAALGPYGLMRYSESSVRFRAAKAPRRQLRPQASYPNRLFFEPERFARLTAAILRWLQQPTHTISSRHGSQLSQHSHRLT